MTGETKNDIDPPGHPMTRHVNPILGYACGTVIASGFYIVWLFASLTFAQSPGETASLRFTFGFVVFFFIFGGFLPALSLMIAPWILAVRAYRRVKIPGPIYYATAGAICTVLIGCATASLAPKPLFVDNQTFIEGAIVAAERQGIVMLLAGVLFGLTYWLLSGRHRPSATNTRL